MAKRKDIAWQPVRNIAKSVGGNKVSKEAVDLMQQAAIDYVRKLAADSLQLTRHSKRVKMSKEDVDLVLKMKDKSCTSD